MTFQGKSVVVTGGAQGIGKCVAECFGREGAVVHVIDIKPGPWFVGDPEPAFVEAHSTVQVKDYSRHARW